MILVDSSVWIAYLRDIASPEVETLDGLIRGGADICITEPVIMELLAGAQGARNRAQVENLVNGLPLLGLDPGADFRGAAELYRASMANGHPIRSMTDCLIATVAIRRDVPLLERDRDFAYLAQVSSLRLHR